MRTIYQTQGSYCAVIKMVFQRISVVCRKPGVECLNKHGVCGWEREGGERQKPFPGWLAKRASTEHSGRKQNLGDKHFAAKSQGGLVETHSVCGTPPPEILTQEVWAGPESLYLSQAMLQLLARGSYFEYQHLDSILSKGIDMSLTTRGPEVISCPPRRVKGTICPES